MNRTQLKCVQPVHVELRKVQDTHRDSSYLWMLRNSPRVRKSCVNTECIVWESHCQWFTQRLNDPRSSMFVLLVPSWSDLYVGYGRMWCENNTVTISYAVGVSFTGQGFGKFIVERLCVESLSVGALQVKAVVKRGNVASIQTLLNNGFHRCSFSYPGTQTFIRSR